MFAAGKDKLKVKKKNVNFCHLCGDGGNLVCCDTCAGAFHSQCIEGYASPLDGEIWQCPVRGFFGRANFHPNEI
jgi:hypothetical protein